MILLDTVDLSETRKSKPSPKVIAWLKTLRDDDIYLLPLNRLIKSTFKVSVNCRQIALGWIKLSTEPIEHFFLFCIFWAN